jgi:hypothetical protein
MGRHFNPEKLMIAWSPPRWRNRATAGRIAAVPPTVEEARGYAVVVDRIRTDEKGRRLPRESVAINILRAALLAAFDDIDLDEIDKVFREAFPEWKALLDEDFEFAQGAATALRAEEL